MANVTVAMGGLLKKPLVQVSLIGAVFLIWMSTGDTEPTTSAPVSAAPVKVIPKVTVEQYDADLISRSITLYGKTAADRQTTLGAEIPGRVAEVFAQRGAFVKQGDVIAKMEINDLYQRLDRAKALLEQREIEYTGAKELASKGFQGKARLAAAKAALSDAVANVYSLELNIEKTTIIAPISGILNERHVEVGDYLAKGNRIATITDINPLIVRADVTETNVSKLKLDQTANVRLINDRQVEGKIRYISRVANAATNTFRIEVAVENDDLSLSAGGSAEIELPLQQEWAVKLSPATLALDEVGTIGVKTVVDDHVVFTPIDIVKADAKGSWLSGLGKKPVVITIGQGFVRDGDRVESVFARND